MKYVAAPLVPGQAYTVNIKRSGVGSGFTDQASADWYLLRLRCRLPVYRVRLHAYYLSDDAILMLLTPLMPNAAAALFKSLNRDYSHYFNNRYQRQGLVWCCRPRFKRIDGCQQILAGYRFLEIELPRQKSRSFSCTSYAINAFTLSSTLLTPHSCLQNFHKSQRDPFRRWRTWLSTPNSTVITQ